LPAASVLVFTMMALHGNIFSFVYPLDENNEKPDPRNHLVSKSSFVLSRSPDHIEGQRSG